MQHNTSFHSSFDGIRLFQQEWTPDEKPLAIIMLVHGIGEHSDRYIHWAEKFVSNQIALIAFDQRGHGRSEGKRGVISSYKEFLNDIDLVLDETRRKFSGIPVFLYGHSMGGGEVLNHLLKCKPKYDGVICTSPWIAIQSAPPKFALPLIRLCNKLIPGFTIETKFDSALLSHDPDIVKRYDNDSLVHHKLSFRLFVEAYDAGYYILNSKKSIEKPLLLIHGAEDGITESKASSAFAEKNLEYCTFELWPAGYHELHNEPFKDEVYNCILGWITKVLNGQIK